MSIPVGFKTHQISKKRHQHLFLKKYNYILLKDNLCLKLENDEIVNQILITR